MMVLARWVFVNGLMWKLISSFDPFACVGQPTPGWAQWLLDNKIYACMMTFFLFNGNFLYELYIIWIILEKQGLFDYSHILVQ